MTKKNDIFTALIFNVMNRKKFFNTGTHILFCLLFVYWFSTNSFIRPYAINSDYKEIVSALWVLLLIYLNYIILTPYFLKRNNYKSYIALSLLLIGVISIAELLLVKSNILRCFANLESFNIDRYLFNISFVIFLRNSGIYLFFTILALYQQTKTEALLEKKAALKDTGLILLPTVQGDPKSINICFVSYFSQNKNDTFVHWTIGKPSHIYSSLSYIQSYLDEYCLRISRDTIITFTNILSYNAKEVIVVDGKTKSKIILPFYKKYTEFVLSVLRKKVPELEEKTVILTNKLQDGGIKNDKKDVAGGINHTILEVISTNPHISIIKLAEILEKKTSFRTLERKLKELKDAGKIEYKGSNKTGGYYIVN